MPLCSNCNEILFSFRIQDSPLILEKLRWESGPASIPDLDEVLPTIQSAQQELEGCDRQIKALESRRKNLLDYTTQLQSLLSPFRKVPDEILRRVFDECCDMNHFAVTKTRTDAIRSIPALALSSVCSRWRRNGMCMPEIWSRISLVRRNAYSDDVDEERLLFTLDIFLDRALQHPLTVNMDFDEPCRALTRLINHVHRFSSFTYESEGYGLSILTSYLSHPSSNFPLLEGLSGQIRNEVLEMFAHTAPKLKDLVLSSITTHDSSEISLFAQLLHLEFYYPYVHEIHTLMDSNHHLVSLKTEESVLQLDEDETLPIPTICGTIHTLTLCHDPMTWQDYSVLPYLTLPSLTTIHFERNLFYERRAKMVEPHIRQGDWDNFDPFMAFLARSSCLLTTLSIESLALADLKLIDLLAHLPTLLNLSFDGSYVAPGSSPITDRFIESLQVHDTDSNRPIVPRLHSLKLNVGASTFNDGSIVDMVRSRWISGKRNASSSRESEPQVDCLRELTIRFRNREEAKGVYEPLEDMDRDGMRVVVLWGN